MKGVVLYGVGGVGDRWQLEDKCAREVCDTEPGVTGDDRPSGVERGGIKGGDEDMIIGPLLCVNTSVAVLE
jgi:hypothetical protein